jgi:hypothetical protein
MWYAELQGLHLESLCSWLECTFQLISNKGYVSLLLNFSEVCVIGHIPDN